MVFLQKVEKKQENEGPKRNKHNTRGYGLHTEFDMVKCSELWDFGKFSPFLQVQKRVKIAL